VECVSFKLKYVDSDQNNKMKCSGIFTFTETFFQNLTIAKALEIFGKLNQENVYYAQIRDLKFSYNADNMQETVETAHFNGLPFSEKGLKLSEAINEVIKRIH